MKKKPKTLTDSLCDKCLAMVERDPNIPVGEFCHPCRVRLIQFVFEPSKKPF
jgi:hypothetical protein